MPVSEFRARAREAIRQCIGTNATKDVDMLESIEPRSRLSIEDNPNDPFVQQFNRLAAQRECGGLLMRGVEDIQALHTYIESIPNRVEDVDRKRLERYSYIRSDTTMVMFSGRHIGVLVDHLKFSIVSFASITDRS
ncbi:unnamed protein product [Didymodactylos carnosus]|uniref:Uncharacterized protein n=1 Tax=Didymodactylos carnosus TaxID=1234261 RepID=A0A815N9F5_9BILA|nr:unnamed protein product [Didymodactylos carnosus]CAF1430927.1 unnamed protein product [Didymodactylos carnosus]CAF3759281.1 unnamed protein product [Didymodactylos carnosus]CAF4309687.1 unnamed protein product [Didymodactylos carnosus]